MRSHVKINSMNALRIVAFRCCILFATLMFQSGTQLVEAFPGAAGHCSTGDLSGKNSGHGENGGGSLFNGSLQVKFDSTVLQTFTTTSLNANQVYTVKLDFFTSNPDFSFRGFLFRLSGKNNENVEGTFYVGDDGNVQSKSCPTGISGMTHTSRSDKTSVEFNFEYTESTNAELLLEVTVVKLRAADNWFYSSYNLQIGNEETPVTSSPSAFPSAAPVEPSSCDDSTLRFRTFKPDGSKIWRDCSWVATQSTNMRCSWEGVSGMCPSTCNKCEECSDSSSRFRVNWNGKRIARDCGWVGNKATKQRCAVDGVSESCRETCGTC